MTNVMEQKGLKKVLCIGLLSCLMLTSRPTECKSIPAVLLSAPVFVATIGGGCATMLFGGVGLFQVGVGFFTMFLGDEETIVAGLGNLIIAAGCGVGTVVGGTIGGILLKKGLEADPKENMTFVREVHRHKHRHYEDDRRLRRRREERRNQDYDDEYRRSERH